MHVPAIRSCSVQADGCLVPVWQGVHTSVTAEVARVRFDASVTDVLVVLDAEREVLTHRDQLAQAQADTATALVSLYRALGGGWAAPASVTARTGVP